MISAWSFQGQISRPQERENTTDGPFDYKTWFDNVHRLSCNKVLLQIGAEDQRKPTDFSLSRGGESMLRRAFSDLIKGGAEGEPGC